MTESELIILQRDCIALMVPSGARIMLHEGTEVKITQSLGDSYTVNVYGNLARIEGDQADALGKKPVDVLEDLSEGLNLQEKIQALLHQVYDPEIPMNIWDLGLVYGVDTSNGDQGQHHVEIDMTLTAPGCGMGPVIAQDVERIVLRLPEVASVEVKFVFDPPWDRSMMSDVARLELGML
jgi:probable FeS assembly SUF system protein SufT